MMDDGCMDADKHQKSLATSGDTAAADEGWWTKMADETAQAHSGYLIQTCQGGSRVNLTGMENAIDARCKKLFHFSRPER